MTDNEKRELSQKLRKFAETCPIPELKGIAQKLSGYIAFSITAGEPEMRAALEADIAKEYPRFQAGVAAMRAANG